MCVMPFGRSKNQFPQNVQKKQGKNEKDRIEEKVEENGKGEDENIWKNIERRNGNFVTSGAGIVTEN